MFISYQYSYPPESCPDHSGSYGPLTTIQPSKAQNISYFKSYLQNMGLWLI